MTSNQTPKTIAPTPGPYHCKRYRDGTEDTIDIVNSDDSQTIATKQYWDHYDEKSKRIEANMLLLSDAPELRDLLKRLLELASRLPTHVLDVDYYAIELEAAQLFAEIEVRFP